jgi:hypothetical protein
MMYRIQFSLKDKTFKTETDALEMRAATRMIEHKYPGANNIQISPAQFQTSTTRERWLCELACWAINWNQPEMAAELVREFILWKWSARNGKHRGCRHWSLSALNWFWANPPNARARNFRHEHVVPRVVVMEFFLEAHRAGQIRPEEVFEILTNYCIGCVLTRDEDKLLSPLNRAMPDGWNRNDPWARYRAAFASTEVQIMEVGPDMRIQQCVFPEGQV